MRCLTGLNLPMLVEAALNRDDRSLGDLETSCRRAAERGIAGLADLAFGRTS